MPDGKRMVTVMLFGNRSECENARRLIEEAVDNKEQKAKQRAKEYEKKKDEKRRDRQMYHLRHTHDYEELGVPLGASKVRQHLSQTWPGLAQLSCPKQILVVSGMPQQLCVQSSSLFACSPCHLPMAFKVFSSAS